MQCRGKRKGALRGRVLRGRVNCEGVEREWVEREGWGGRGG